MLNTTIYIIPPRPIWFRFIKRYRWNLKLQVYHSLLRPGDELNYVVAKHTYILKEE